jgi:Icc-related predicted phosphoesterase
MDAAHPFDLPDDFSFSALGRRYSEGDLTIDECAAEFGISRDTFLAIRKAAPVTWKKGSPCLWWSDLEDAEDTVVERVATEQKARRIDRKAKQRVKRDASRAAERWWRLERELEQAAEVFAGAGYEPPKPIIRISSRAEKAGALVLNQQDLHVGLWDAGYVEAVKERFERLVSQALQIRKLETAYLVIGGDLVHCDTAAKTTTKGTPLQMAMEPHEALAAAVELVVWQVDYLRALGVEVVLVPVRGNHDRIMSTSAAVAVGQRFHDTEGVSILPIEERVYAVYNDHLMCFTHGDLTKRAMKDMGETIRHEARRLLGSTLYTCLFTGHLHHLAIEDRKGLIHYQTSAPIDEDNWHVKEAWVGSRKMLQGVVLSPDDGADQILHA